MRLIALDTETTGLRAMRGDRIIELAMVEINRDFEPRTWHGHFNPQGQPISEEATRVHGLTADDLTDKPNFGDCLDDILDFIGDDGTLVIHNAPFDLGFLREEFTQANSIWPEPPYLDTLKLARAERPNNQNSLDALCIWQGIDLSVRTHHSALIDTRLLAELYLRWRGQSAFELKARLEDLAPSTQPAIPMNPLVIPTPETARNSQRWGG